MPFRLSFIVPYMQNGVCTMRGPNIFLKDYVRHKPDSGFVQSSKSSPEKDNQEEQKVAKAEGEKESGKDEYKEVMKQFAARDPNNKMANKRRFAEANPTVFSHKGK